MACGILVPWTRSHAPCNGSVESQPLDLKGIPDFCLFLSGLTKMISFYGGTQTTQLSKYQTNLKADFITRCFFRLRATNGSKWHNLMHSQAYMLGPFGHQFIAVKRSSSVWEFQFQCLAFLVSKSYLHQWVAITKTQILIANVRNSPSPFYYCFVFLLLLVLGPLEILSLYWHLIYALNRVLPLSAFLTFYGKKFSHLLLSLPYSWKRPCVCVCGCVCVCVL